MKYLLSSSTRSFILRTAFFAAVLLVGFGCTEALAQHTEFGHVQQGVGRDLIQLPKLFAIASYVIGAFFAADGLLKLKAWMEESEKNSLNAALFRLAVSAMLIYLPHAIVIANTTLFGEGAGGVGNVPRTTPPQLKAF